ncbi:MAG: bifunctional phosphopantothenoylcysteine decarboxylase/phosphopantothenate--cysteine ligase CoaBC [Halobacteriovoraceae bacterium]|nr:bifunctional phosphopantothenoylcysteine decarboxylase/phosphopantothenate--cysteine ligase CoaBC [Halobacteriovoraceae bacterium]|tara:strand:+ start:3581 stop:4777 length:1197 start_codon:yes stop_codon:yes gene_type:complete
MKYVLGVCGSVSAYKACDILRGLIKEGHEVKVILTKGAKNFIPKEQFTYLGATAVYSYNDDFIKREKAILHIDLKHWLDRLVIAPASANTIAKLACGLCDDLLTSVFLSCEEKDKFIFPAMNTSMLTNTITQDNFKRLRSLSNCFIHPTTSGVLACGDEGEGKLPLPEDIVEFLGCYSFLKNERSVLITTGATKAPLDPVRYLTNPSSGKTGIELCRAYLKSGYNVTLVAGEEVNIPKAFYSHPNITVTKVMTTGEMFSEVDRIFPQTDIFISTAAVSDIKFKTSNAKLKKSDKVELDFEWDRDILKTMLEKRSHQKIVGFAAETQLSEEKIAKKLESKPVDLLIANEVSNGFDQAKKGFGSIGNKYTFIKNGKIDSEIELSKSQLAEKILNEVNQLW